MEERNAFKGGDGGEGVTQGGLTLQIPLISSKSRIGMEVVAGGVISL